MGVALDLLGELVAIGVPVASWMPSETATTQRPWRSMVAFTSARKRSSAKSRSGR